MGPTSWGFLALVAILATVLLVATVLFWERGRRLRRTRNAGALCASQILTAVLLVALINAHEQFYTSWSDVFGIGGPGTTAVADTHTDPRSALLAPAPNGYGTGLPGALDLNLGHLHHQRGHAGSMVSTIVIPGVRTGYRYPADVYLPSAYFDPSTARRTFPVVELFVGTFSSRSQWFSGLGLQKVLDHAIDLHLLPPVIAIAPTQAVHSHSLDHQCLDDPHGMAAFTYLADDVPDALPTLLRARRDRNGWAAMGFSSGAYCAANIAIHRPDRFATVVGLSGYYSGPGSRTPLADPLPTPAERVSNSPVLDLSAAPEPLTFILFAAGNDAESRHELESFARAVQSHAADRLISFVTPRGGHSAATWRTILPTLITALDEELRQPIDNGLTLSTPPRATPSDPAKAH